MKLFALSIIVASAAICAPALAVDFKDGHRLNAYYSAAERDRVDIGVVKMSKWDIKNMQLALRDAGYKTGPIDGILGVKTRAALKHFQKDRNLKITGKATPITLGALRVATRVDFDHKLSRNYN